MKFKSLLAAFAVTISSAAFAADPAPTSKMECCCCKKDESGKMACCKEKADKAGDDHSGHDMSKMDHK